MAKKKEVTVEQRLRALYDLQLIDSRIDEIRNVRGELPLEVRDLEDEVAGLNIRLDKLVSNLEGVDNDITSKKNAIEESKALIKKYSEQQKNVRNNREYNSLTKEMASSITATNSLERCDTSITDKPVPAKFTTASAVFLIVISGKIDGPA